jgi:peptidoglycan/LPS O-acetylase OafA/YrhL
MLAAPGVVKSGRFDLRHVMASYLFIPATNPFTGAIEPVLAPGWTLNYEMFFYAAFGALLFLPARRQFAAMGACLTGAMLLGAVFSDHLVLRFYGSSIIGEFGFGMLLGAAFLRGWMLATGVAWLSVAVGLLTLALGSDLRVPRALVSGLPALALVAGGLSLEAFFRLRKIRILQSLGDASYSLYLSHGIVLSAAGQIALVLGLARLPGIIPLFILAGGATAALVALILHRILEMPLARFFSVRPVAIGASGEPAGRSSSPG